MCKLITSIGVFLAFIVSLKAHQHQAVYKVYFPQGSHIVNDEVKNNTFKVYRSMPEKSFSKMRMGGQQEEEYAPSLKYLLAKNRSLAVMNYLQQKGMERNHVKISYAGEPFLIVFKESAQKVENSYVNTELTEASCNCYDIDLTKDFAIYTQNQHYIFIPAFAFETLNGIGLHTGTIRFCINTIDLSEKIALAWHDVKKDRIHIPVYEFYTKVSYNGLPVQLKPYVTMQVHLFQEKNALNNGVLHWENLAIKDKKWQTQQHKNLVFYKEQLNLFNYQDTKYFFEENSPISEVNHYWAVNIGTLGWNRLSYLSPTQQKPIQKELVMVDDQRYMLRFVEENTGLVLPIYGDNNFNNLYYLSYFSTHGGSIIAYRPEINNCWKVAYELRSKDLTQQLTVVPEFQEANHCFVK